MMLKRQTSLSRQAYPEAISISLILDPSLTGLSSISSSSSSSSLETARKISQSIHHLNNNSSIGRIEYDTIEHIDLQTAQFASSRDRMNRHLEVVTEKRLAREAMEQEMRIIQQQQDEQKILDMIQKEKDEEDARKKRIEQEEKEMMDMLKREQEEEEKRRVDAERKRIEQIRIEQEKKEKEEERKAVKIKEALAVLTPSQREKVLEFQTLTGEEDIEIAKAFMDRFKWDSNTAIANYFEYSGDLSRVPHRPDSNSNSSRNSQIARPDTPPSTKVNNNNAASSDLEMDLGANLDITIILPPNVRVKRQFKERNTLFDVYTFIFTIPEIGNRSFMIGNQQRLYTESELDNELRNAELGPHFVIYIKLR